MLRNYVRSSLSTYDDSLRDIASQVCSVAMRLCYASSVRDMNFLIIAMIP